MSHRIIRYPAIFTIHASQHKTPLVSELLPFPQQCLSLQLHPESGKFCPFQFLLWKTLFLRVFSCHRHPHPDWEKCKLQAVITTSCICWTFIYLWDKCTFVHSNENLYSYILVNTNIIAKTIIIEGWFLFLWGKLYHGAESNRHCCEWYRPFAEAQALLWVKTQV